MNIRNFAIIAHIDHGKSTLADRIMEMTATITKREASDQLLDSMAVEQAHGVTVKSRTVRNIYHADDGQEYEFNLIDTPGHVDFNYEVEKSLSAAEGAILLVDATQGVQAQTVANYRLARQAGIVVLPVVNKVDSASADVDRTENQIRTMFPELKNSPILPISAKTGLGVHDVLEAIVHRLPAPTANDQLPLKALVFDSEYDAFQGVIAYVRVFEGVLSAQTNLTLMANALSFNTKEIGILTPNRLAQTQLHAGDVGYVITGVKDPQLVRVGDTLTETQHPTNTALPGYAPAQSMVFAGIYPQDDYSALKDAINKLALNDPSLHVANAVSDALGPGFYCGFLGIFHLQIIKERLHDEYGVDVIVTAPNVTYRVTQNNGTGDLLTVTNPQHFPDFNKIEHVEEPRMRIELTTPAALLNDVMRLANQHKGEFVDMANQDDLVVLTYTIPLAEIAYSFFNELKSLTHGYASLSTRFDGYAPADVVRVDVQINYARVDALTFVTYRSDVADQTQELVHKLKYVVPRRLYPMPVQAIVEGKSIARVDIPPLRKNAAVNGESHSISKKQQLLRRQNSNKRAAAHSDIELPQEVFDAILTIES
ncbi:translation elongation factor 4 [Secundilactobacillus paracollinoides]|uniref:Elongation factor 4 n=1 Tax=Secundilactobacillus paracollinoides TaxID=240427 RepID=A0A1B2IVZ6_9LACO|nr:translation elongation factor 4 [Secundilactobacillus paracollinoides]ANZ60371.1 elongation factor 4 [Secundilactobacillus paracollinoides]ANZ66199.1 elongation factor 4 [Secundilactobacillus paracollinoides]